MELTARQRDQDFADVGFEKQLEIARHYGPLHQVRHKLNASQKSAD